MAPHLEHIEFSTVMDTRRTIVGSRCFMHLFLADAASYVVVIEALEQGVKDGMDILTLSIASVADCVGWASTTIGIVADRIAQSGKIITIAVGNNGDLGSWCVSSPATGNDVISV